MSTSSPINDYLFSEAANRVAQRCDSLGEVSDVPGELTRVFCSPSMKIAHGLLGNWFENAGMAFRLDQVGNLIGISGTLTAERPVLMIGSHIDTVVNAGRFDGSLGVLLGIGVVEFLREMEIDIPFDIHVVAFSEEEGVRYGFPFIGSLGITGLLSAADLERKDDDGISMAKALKEFGCNASEFAEASYVGKNVIGFIEPHLEQSVALTDAGIPVGVVGAIVGQNRAMVEFRGSAGHAGTVPHENRKDALAAAAECLLEIEKLGQQTDGLFATVGSVESFPGLSNVICGRARLRFELRHESDAARHAAHKKVATTIERISDRRGVEAKILEAAQTPAVPMDDALMGHVSRSIVNVGHESMRLVSGAGHDAMIMANLVPSCMLFIRCKDGISHQPQEFVAPDDMRTALRVLVDTVLGLANEMQDRRD